VERQFTTEAQRHGEEGGLDKKQGTFLPDFSVALWWKLFDAQAGSLLHHQLTPPLPLPARFFWGRGF
jgi:hypothetical protein